MGLIIVNDRGDILFGDSIAEIYRAKRKDGYSVRATLTTGATRIIADNITDKRAVNIIGIIIRAMQQGGGVVNFSMEFDQYMNQIGDEQQVDQEF